MKRIHLKTDSSSHLVTMGSLSYQGIPFLVTLERPWRFNEPFKSCLAPGVYTVERYTSNKYSESDLVWEVKDVYGRTVMLIHAGNWVKNSKGCILPGLRFGPFDKEPSVRDSRAALKELSRLTNNEPFQLIVHDRV